MTIGVGQVQVYKGKNDNRGLEDEQYPPYNAVIQIQNKKGIGKYTYNLLNICF